MEANFAKSPYLSCINLGQNQHFIVEFFKCPIKAGLQKSLILTGTPYFRVDSNQRLLVILNQNLPFIWLKFWPKG